ncbi:hypothetical protein N9I81_00095 [Planktomarina temperata]|nr:hypothetical protein [Planktomarina temperata]
MTSENDKLLSLEMLQARNAILIEFGDYSFDQALDEVKNSLLSEKNNATRLALLSAKSWIIRNKVYAMMHEPFVYALNELENTNIFSDTDDDDTSTSGLSGLFDDDDDDGDGDGDVQVTVTKTTTLNGIKLVKDMVVSVKKDDAEKLVLDKKAKYLE